MAAEPPQISPSLAHLPQVLPFESQGIPGVHCFPQVSPLQQLASWVQVTPVAPHPGVVVDEQDLVLRLQTKGEQQLALEVQ